VLDQWATQRAGKYEVFLHAVDHTDVEQRLIRNAAKVFCGNRELHATLKGLRPDIIELFCPGTILSPQRVHRTELQVFTFGMAHKIRVEYYRKLRDLLEGTRQTYKIFVSTALHEGTSFDESFIVRFEELQEIFQGRVYFMGYLSDTAVFNHLTDATFLAAFFEKGLRANNTTVNAAMECGCAVLTNLDEYSPLGYDHMSTVLDINRTDRLPDIETLARIGQAARAVAHSRYGWDQLVSQIKSVALA
jgi:glycosyltransferase involved in cell wall biosynthesis